MYAVNINTATYHFLKLIAEYDHRNAWAGYGIHSCAHWLSWKCGIAMSAAREKNRTAIRHSRIRHSAACREVS